MACTQDTDLIHKALKTTLENEVKAAMEPVIEKAKADLEAKLRARIGEIALALFQRYTIERNGVDIVIRIQNEVKT